MSIKVPLLMFCIVVLAQCAPTPQPLPTDDPILRRSSEALAMSLSERRDISGGPIPYYRADAWDGEVFAPRETADPLSLVDWGPDGTIPIEISRPVVYVVFSQPITPLAALGEPQSQSNQMQISPGIAGRFRWLGSRTLAFEPAQPITGSRTYSVTVPENVTSLGGKRLGEPFSFTFSSPELDFVDLFPGTPGEPYWGDIDDVPPEVARSITVVFNHEPDPRELQNHLQLTAANRPIDYRIEQPSDDLPSLASGQRPPSPDRDSPAMRRRTILLIPDQPLPPNSRIEIGLAAGARAASDQQGRTSKAVRAFHTLQPFEPVKLDGPVWGFPRVTGPDRRPVYLAFSHAIDPDSVAGNISIDLPVPDLANHVEVWDRYVRLNALPVEYETRYAVVFGPGLADVYGRSLGRNVTVSVEVPALPRFRRLPDGGPRMLEAQFPPAIVWEHVNVTDGLFLIERTTDPYERIPSSRLRPFDFSAAARNERNFERVDLRPWLSDNGTGFVRLAWNLGETDASGRRQSWWQEDLMVQVTDLGVTTRIGFNRVLVWVHSLSTGSPVSGAAVSLLDSGLSARKRGVTDENGLAVVSVAPGEYRDLFARDNRDTIRVLAEHDGDRVMLRPNWSHNPYRHGVWNTMNPYQVETVQHEPLIFTDRGLYRPGEEVSLRGIDRHWSDGRYQVYTGAYRLAVIDQNRGDRTIAEVSGSTSAQGGFFMRFRLPADATPGYYAVVYERGGARYTTHFQVAYFRSAAFAVSISPEQPLFFRDQTIGITTRADYLSGGPVAEASVSVGWFRQPVEIELLHPDLGGYRFGPLPHYGFQLLASYDTQLDSLGTTQLTFDTATEPESETPSDPTLDDEPSMEPDSAISQLRAGTAYRYEVEARIQDPALQEIAARSSVVVYPTPRVIGIRLGSAGAASGTASGTPSFVATGTPLPIEMILADVEREAPAVSSMDVEVELIHHSWRVSQQRGVGGRIRTNYEPYAETVWTGATRVQDGRGTTTVTPQQPGSYTVRITSREGSARLLVTEASFYATGAEWVRWAGEEPDGISIVPDKASYRPGETARLLIQSPIPRGSYLLTIEREGILDHRLIELEGSANVIELPITASHLPVIYLSISSHRERVADPTGYLEPDLGKPAGYFGMTTIAVAADQHRLDVNARFDKNSYRPGELATVHLSVTRQGRPVSAAEVTFVAADRGVLDLIGYRIPDPLDFFYSPSRFPLGVIGADSRSMLLDPVTFDITTLRGGDAGKDGGNRTSLRFDFNPLAVFEPAVITDGAGTATVRFVFPDTLTTYRATALAVSKGDFGIIDREIMVTQPLAVRLAVPRRLRVRDSSQAGVVITNTTTAAQRVTVTAKATTDAIELHGSDRRNITVQPGASAAVSFGIAARRAGTGEMRFSIQSDLLSEVVGTSIPIDQPDISEAVTVTGRADPHSEESVVIPSFLPDGTGSLELQTGTTRSGDLMPAIDRLMSTRYTLTDQRIDRMLPTVLFGPGLTDLAGRYPFDRDAVVGELEAIGALQNSDGGIPFTDRQSGGPSSPWLSVRFAHLLGLADSAGISSEVLRPDGTIRTELDRHLLGITNTEQLPLFVRAYALWILSARGVPVRAQRAALSRDAERIGSSELALLALGEFESAGFRDANPDEFTRLVRILTNRIRVEARTMDLVEPFFERFFFDSQVTSLSLLQMVQIRADAHPDMLDRIANTLNSRRQSGYWVGGHDTAWSLIAQSELIRHEGALDADLAVEISLADQTLVSYRATGAEKSNAVTFAFADSPLSDMPRNRALSMQIAAVGTGSLAYSATMRYALPQEVLLPREEGLSVVREIIDLNGQPTEVEQMVAGQTYRMRVVLSSPARHSMVSLRIPVPSGAEILDQSFETTGRYRDAGGVQSEQWQRETSFGDTETVLAQGMVEIGFLGGRFTAFQPVRTIYDGEMVLVYPDLGAGRRTVEFLIRAVTPGVYPLPPAFAEAIYTPEVFGRSGGELARIGEPR